MLYLVIITLSWTSASSCCFRLVMVSQCVYPYWCGNNEGFLALLTPLQFDVSYVAFMKFKSVRWFLQCIKFSFEPYGLQDIHDSASSFSFPSFFFGAVAVRLLLMNLTPISRYKVGRIEQMESASQAKARGPQSVSIQYCDETPLIPSVYTDCSSLS